MWWPYTHTVSSQKYAPSSLFNPQFQQIKHILNNYAEYLSGYLPRQLSFDHHGTTARASLITGMEYEMERWNGK